MAFFDKLGDLAKNIGDKATDAIETTKLNSKISAEKTAIAECMRQIGEYYYAKRQAGEPVEHGIQELFAAIDEHNRLIADTQAEISRIQAENAAQAQAAATVVPAAAVPVAADVFCPACGRSNVAGTKFCSECGAKLETPANRGCPGCGARVPLESKFCGECGYRFE